MIEAQTNYGGILFIRVCVIMEEKDIKERIPRSYERYCSYDLKVWSLAFFDEKTGGYVVVNRNRMESAWKSSNRRDTYDKELKMAKVFARNGYAIEMVEEDTNVVSYDVLIDGRPADFKKTKGTSNIYKYAKEAVRKQGAKVVLFQFEENTETVQLELLWLKRMGYEVMYFFTDEQKVYIL